MSITSRLNSTALVMRKARTTNDRGGNTTAHTTTAYASLDCRVSIKGSSERFLGDKIDSNASHVIFIASGSTIKLSDQFVVGSDTYTINGINKPSRGAHIELEAELINKGA